MWMVLLSILVLSVFYKIILPSDLLPKPFLRWLFRMGHSDYPSPTHQLLKAYLKLLLSEPVPGLLPRHPGDLWAPFQPGFFHGSMIPYSMLWTLDTLWVSHNTAEAGNLILPFILSKFTLTKCTIKDVLGELGHTSAHPTASLLHPVSLYHVCAHNTHLPYRPVLNVPLPIHLSYLLSLLICRTITGLKGGRKYCLEIWLLTLRKISWLFSTVTVPKCGHFQRLPVSWKPFFSPTVFNIKYFSTAYKKRLIQKVKAKSFALPCAEPQWRETLPQQQARRTAVCSLAHAGQAGSERSAAKWPLSALRKKKTTATCVTRKGQAHLMGSQGKRRSRKTSLHHHLVVSVFSGINPAPLGPFLWMIPLLTILQSAKRWVRTVLWLHQECWAVKAPGCDVFLQYSCKWFSFLLNVPWEFSRLSASATNLAERAYLCSPQPYCWFCCLSTRDRP